MCMTNLPGPSVKPDQGLTSAAVDVCCTELTSTPVLPSGMCSALRKWGFCKGHTPNLAQVSAVHGVKTSAEG